MARLWGKLSKKVAIIGGGASGIFCALQILEAAPDTAVTIFEKNEPLKSLLPTGGGRCNLSHNELDFRALSANYPRGEKFLYSVFSKFGVEKTLKYFEKIGVKTYVQPNGRIFPVSNSANDVKNALLASLKKFKSVEIERAAIHDTKMLEGFDFIVVATGSKGGYELAQSFGHTLTQMAPALCGYVTREKYPAGVTIDVNGEALLFTHIGISGPYVYKLSSVNAFKEFPFELSVPFLDADLVWEKIRSVPKKSFKNLLVEFVPKSLAQALMENLNLSDVQCANVKKSDIEKLKTLNFTVIKPDKHGETVRAGGVSLSEITNNCQSKILSHLYFIGEILDIDGFCGGFNLQAAWATAAVAAGHITAEVTAQNISKKFNSKI